MEDRDFTSPLGLIQLGLIPCARQPVGFGEPLLVDILVCDFSSASRILTDLCTVWQDFVALHQMPLGFAMRTDPMILLTGKSAHLSHRSMLILGLSNVLQDTHSY